MAGRPLVAGEQVMLIDGKDRRYLVRLEAGGEFHTHAGILSHDGIIGADEGALLRANSGVTYRVIRPTLTDFVLKMKRGAQVIYPKDLGPLLLLVDVFPGARILESGRGASLCARAENGSEGCVAIRGFPVPSRAYATGPQWQSGRVGRVVCREPWRFAGQVLPGPDR